MVTWRHYIDAVSEITTLRHHPASDEDDRDETVGYAEKRRAALERTMRDEVFRVTVAVLSGEGFEALTMDRIAREVGVSRATLYNYFADADAVAAFVESTIFEPIALRVEAIATGSLAPQAKLAAILSTLLDALHEDRALVLALFAKRELRGQRAEQKVRNRARMLEIFRSIVGEGVRSGVFREVSPGAAAEVLVGTVAGVIDSMVYTGEVRRAEELVPALLDVVLEGLNRKG